MMGTVYLNVPEKVKAKRRGSLPGLNLRKVVGLKSLEGLKPNRSHSDLQTLSGLTPSDRKKSRSKTSVLCQPPTHHRVSKSSEDLTHIVPSPKQKKKSLGGSNTDNQKDGHQSTFGSPIITLTLPTPDIMKKSGNSSAQVPDLSTNHTPSPLSHDSRTPNMRQRDHSPLVSRRSIGGESNSGTDGVGVGKMKLIHTADGLLSGLASGSDSGSVPMGTLEDEDTDLNGGELGSGSDITEDVVDGGSEYDIQTQQALRQIKDKIQRTKESIQEEQKAKEENVNEYLRCSNNPDKVLVSRVKSVFEKKNAKSTATIRHLTEKLEGYKKRQREIETNGVRGPRKPKEVMKDMGQGLKVLFTRDGKTRDPSPSRSRDVGANIRDGITGFSGGVVDNIRGAKDSIVSKPKEIVHLVKNKFGSADNINSLKTLEDTQGSTDDNTDKQSRGGTLPSGFQFQCALSEDGDEAISTVSSESRRSAAAQSAGIHSNTHSAPPMHSATSNEAEPRFDLTQLIVELRQQREAHDRLAAAVESIKGQLQEDYASVKTILEEEKYRMERFEEGLNDLTELHQHEVTNIKQELQSMEEKHDYQLDERTRDMQELLESCSTRITKMELQQQQQQLISVEAFENSNFRNLITKLINVVLAVLAVLLVLLSTAVQLLGPFLNSRFRILSTIILIAVSVLAWQHWTFFTDVSHSTWDHVLSLLPFR